MSGPRQPKTLPPGPSRRAFFRRGGAAAAAALSVAPALGLARADQNAVGNGMFQHGVASGDPLADRVILWTRVTVAGAGKIQVGYVIGTDPTLVNVVRRGIVSTDADRDHTVKVDVSGLSAGTTYYYRFAVGAQTSPIGRTRTAPAGPLARLRLAVVSCSNHAFGLFNAYRRLAERADLDAVVHLGDYLYEYGPNTYGNLRTPEPPNEIVTLSDYRLRHAQYKADADLQAVHRQHPMICIWDDHEITNDAWAGGAENHQPATEGDWSTRVNVGLRAYYEWMPVRVAKGQQPRSNQRAFSFGNLVDLVMLEERLSARSQQLPATIPTQFGNAFAQTGAFADPTRTLLGAEQESWLAQRLRTSTARWKLLGQGVMFAQLKIAAAPNASGGGLFVNSDQWDGYQPARNRVYEIFEGAAGVPEVANCVVLTGDIHSSWASDLSRDPNNPNPASGGYNATTGEGSKAVEFVTTSITSPGLDDPSGQTAAFLRSVNPHFKYIDLNRRGYMLLDVTPARVVGVWWYVDTVASASNVQSFGVAFEVQAGSNRLVPSAQTTPPANPPALAP